MKKALYVAGPIGLTLLVLGAGWAVLAPRVGAAGYRSLMVAGAVLALLSAWGQRDALFQRGGVRKARLGAGALATVGISTALLLLVNFAAARYQHRWDLTRDGSFSLHAATSRVLAQVERDVDVYAFVPASEPLKVRTTRELYETFQLEQPRVRVTVADPTRRPDLVEKTGVRASNVTVVVSGDRKPIVFPGAGEADLAAAILEAGRQTPRVVYWVVGMGERNPDATGGTGYAQFQQELRQNFYQLRALSLGAGEKVPADASLLIFADPRRPLSPAEVETYDAWLREGHRALVLSDVDIDQPETGDHPMAALLDRWGLKPVRAAVLDPRARTGVTDPRTVVADGFGKHPAVEALSGMMSIMTLARPLGFGQVMNDQQIFHHALAWVGPDQQGRGADPYATTDLPSLRAGTVAIDPAVRAAWGDRRLVVALAAFRRFEATSTTDIGRESRVILVGDADFLNDQNIRREANGELAMNLVRWLTGEEMLIRREGEKPGERRTLFLEPAQTMVVRMIAVVLPVSIFLAGWIVWFARRSK